MSAHCGRPAATPLAPRPASAAPAGGWLAFGLLAFCWPVPAAAGGLVIYTAFVDDRQPRSRWATSATSSARRLMRESFFNSLTWRWPACCLQR
jgi:hypothetical protein